LKMKHLTPWPHHHHVHLPAQRAMSLCPRDSHAYNRLAILSLHGDVVDVVYHYLRTLAVRHPILTARDALTSIFEKAFSALLPLCLTAPDQSKDTGAGRS
jgi:hypothetical protein